MQKKLIALAVAGLMAAPVVMAQSNVTIYGRMDIGAFNKDDAAGRSVFKVDNSGWFTSRLGFRGTEDLGNGLKAIFQIESRLQNDVDAALNTNRDTFVGLGGNFGEVRLGRNSTPLNNWLVGFDHTGSNAFRVTNPNFRGLETRVSNSIVYVAPSMSGLTVAALYAPDEEKGVNEDTYGVGLRYANGPIAAAYTIHRKEDLVKEQFVGASYDFGAAKVLATFIHRNWDASSTREKSWSVGLAAPVGAGTVSLGYGRENDVNGVDNADNRVWAVGYKHDLSARTFAYAGYQNQKLKGADSRDVYGVGVSHAF